MYQADITRRGGSVKLTFNGKLAAMKSPVSLMVVVVVVLIAVGSSISFALSTGSSKSNSLVPTRVYLAAKYVFAQALLRNASFSQALQNKLVARVATKCPNALRNAPHNHSEREITRWIIHTVTLTLFRASRQAIARFDATTQSLRWPNKRIGALVRALNGRRAFVAQIPLSNLCGGASAWARGGFRTLPINIVRLNRRMSVGALAGLSEGPGTYEEALLRLLAPYETSHELAIARQIKLIKLRANRQSEDALHPAWVQIYDQIGL